MQMSIITGYCGNCEGVEQKQLVFFDGVDAAFYGG